MADGLPPVPTPARMNRRASQPDARTAAARCDPRQRPRRQGPQQARDPAAAGGGVAVVLLLASGAFSSDPSRKPADTKPMMSDPARPEMAQGAIRNLPANYTEAAARAGRTRHLPSRPNSVRPCPATSRRLRPSNRTCRLMRLPG